MDQTFLQVNQYMDHIKVLCNASSDQLPGGTKFFNPPVVSGIGDLIMTDDDMATYVETLMKLEDFLKWQVQRYKDCFPCDTPVGGLVSTVYMLCTILENEIVHPSLPALQAPDSGVVSSPDSDENKTPFSFDTKKTTKLQKEPFHETLLSLVRAGTVERYMRLSELAMPVEEHQVSRLCKLASLIMEEVDSDAAYFQKPFSA
jgi:hypothetical protein